MSSMSKPIRIREVVPGIYRSPLPLARELASFAEAGGRAVVDLTQRPRDTIARACERHGLTYVKHPLPYEHGDIDRAADAILAMAPGVLFHCFHGRDRTGRVANLIRMRTLGRVVLHRVGRNLNRSVRTCEALGIRRVQLVDCDARVVGNLYGATGRVAVTPLEELPHGPNVLALETGTPTRIDQVDWSSIDTVILGNETTGLPRKLPVQYATVPMCGKVSGLTVEAALAIALHQWRLAKWL